MCVVRRGKEKDRRMYVKRREERWGTREERTLRTQTRTSKNIKERQNQKFIQNNCRKMQFILASAMAYSLSKKSSRGGIPGFKPFRLRIPATICPALLVPSIGSPPNTCQ